jgi:hypothetical protein
MLPQPFLRLFYMVFIGCFLLVYMSGTEVTIHSARVGDIAPCLTGWSIATLSVLLVGLALEELRRVSPKR